MTFEAIARPRGLAWQPKCGPQSPNSRKHLKSLYGIKSAPTERVGQFTEDGDGDDGGDDDQSHTVQDESVQGCTEHAVWIMTESRCDAA